MLAAIREWPKSITPNIYILGIREKTDAEKDYIKLINDLVKNDPAPEPATPSSGGKTFTGITTSIEYSSVYKITLNRPAKYNAINVKV